MERLYTVAEANDALRDVRPRLEELRAITLQLDGLREQATAISQRSRMNGRATEFQHISSDLETLADRARQILLDLDGMGVELKDPRQGLIDFRSRRDGRIVYLCWMLGENDIAYWHDLDAGFQGRQPL